MRSLLFIIAMLPALTTTATSDRTVLTAVAARVTTVRTILAPSDSSDVVKVVEAFHAALAAGDTASALRLLTADVVIQESGGIESRAEYAQHHLAGDIAFARAVPSVRSAVRVVIVGDAAWTTATSTTKGTYRDRTINSIGAELMVLSRSSGVWQIRAIHWSSRTPRV